MLLPAQPDRPLEADGAVGREGCFLDKEPFERRPGPKGVSQQEVGWQGQGWRPGRLRRDRRAFVWSREQSGWLPPLVLGAGVWVGGGGGSELPNPGMHFQLVLL